MDKTQNTVCGPLNGTDYSNVKEMYTGEIPNIDFNMIEGLTGDESWYPSITCCETNEKYNLNDIFGDNGDSEDYSEDDNDFIDLYTIFSHLNFYANSMNPRPKVIQVFAFCCLENKSPQYSSLPNNIIHIEHWPSYLKGDTLKRMVSSPGENFWNNVNVPTFNNFGNNSKLKKVNEHIKYLKKI